jgi:GNAT superfamily N-acetyltransferase
MHWQRDDYSISDRNEDLDRAAIHAFLREAYWSPGLPRAVLDKAIDRSLCFGLRRGEEMIGFARVISDRASFAYLADVFVLPAHRAHGLGKWLIACVLAHPELQGLRRWMLATRDAHGLYRQNGFRELRNPERFMEINDPDIYQKRAESTAPEAGEST